jgi:flagellar basal body-associated protein FliL
MPDLSVSALLLLMLVVAIVIFLGAVWFGLFVVAPRIGRALDRADADEEEPCDRPD